MNGKYTFSFFIVLLLNLNSYSQNNFFSYDRVKVKEIDSIEKKFNSKIYKSKLEYVESTKDSIIRYGKLKNYSRPENKSFGNIKVTYFYLKKDSIVRKINYYWISPKNSKLKDYSKQFDKTVRKISKELNLTSEGQGKLTNTIDDTVEGIPVEITERRVTFKYREAEINIIMLWTEKKGAYLDTSIKWK